MNIFAQIVKNVYPSDGSLVSTTTYSEGSGLLSPATDGALYGEVYICIYDTATGQPANGNNVLVSYQESGNGNFGPVQQVYIPGQSVRIHTGLLQQFSSISGSYYYDVLIVGLTAYNASAPGTAPASPSCDAVINSVTIDQAESDYGAADGAITVKASSTYLPLQYSLDGTSWQSDSNFSKLSGGGYIAYIKDANGCTATYSFNLPANHNILIGDPSVDLGNGNISRWNAAFNPVIFTYQRKDCELTRMEQHYSGNTLVTVNMDVSIVQKDDWIYLNAGYFSGPYQVFSPGSNYNQLVLTLPYQAAMAAVTGFLNSNSLKPYYKILTKIAFQDPFTGQQKIIMSTNRPDITGLVKADLSSFLQSLLRVQDDSTFTALNYRDDNLSASYRISYIEVWKNNYDDDNNDSSRPYKSIDAPYYVIYSAKQLGDTYGGNLAAYVPFKSVISPNQLAKWVTDFAEPAYSEGYPFDIGFIYSEHMAGLNIECEITQLDINRQQLPGGRQTTYLLNEDGSFLLNLDGSKLVINRASITDATLAQHIGLNRLLIQGGFAPQAAYFTLTLKYKDDQGDHVITQTQVVRIDDAVDDCSVYLRWVGLSGSWNYYRFVYNQEISLDVQNATIIKRFVNDWQRQDGIEDVLSKTAGQKMKVMAEDLSVNDIKGLQSLKYSPKVQMLTNLNPITWQTVVLNTATFEEYETRYGQAPFSVTFNLPSINIQTQ